MKMQKFETLTKGEIKKAESLATKLNGIKTQVTGWCTEPGESVEGFKTIRCEMCSHDMSKREDDIIISVCLWDRRKSFASQAW